MKVTNFYTYNPGMHVPIVQVGCSLEKDGDKTLIDLETLQRMLSIELGSCPVLTTGDQSADNPNLNYGPVEILHQQGMTVVFAISFGSGKVKLSGKTIEITEAGEYGTKLLLTMESESETWSSTQEYELAKQLAQKLLEGLKSLNDEVSQ